MQCTSSTQFRLTANTANTDKRGKYHSADNYVTFEPTTIVALATDS